MKKPRFKKFEMHGDLPFKEGIVVNASVLIISASVIPNKVGGEKDEYWNH